MKLRVSVFNSYALTETLIETSFDSGCEPASSQGPDFLLDHLGFVLPPEDLDIWLRAEFGAMLISLY